ncbi:hypothetical protein [Mycobacterium asiaticum]|nr:hypothetical protein [Mycobacterium asiaticum]
MGLSNSAMVDGANGIRAGLGGAQLHTANPGTGGAASKSSASMVVPSWTVPTADGDFDLAAPMVFEGGAPNGTVTWLSLWSNATGSGVWKGNFELTGDLTFDSNGVITIESFALNGSAA